MMVTLRTATSAEQRELLAAILSHNLYIRVGERE